MKIELTFKDSEKEVYDFLKEQSNQISTSDYLKQLILNEMQNRKIIKECLVINSKDESILFTDFPIHFTADEFIKIAKYYFENPNECYFFGDIEFNEDTCCYENRYDDYRCLVDNGNIHYRLNYEDIKNVYENRQATTMFLHRTFCKECDEDLFLYTDEVDTSCECWSCGREYKLDKNTITEVIK